MKKEVQKRSAELYMKAVPLGLRDVYVLGYNTSGQFVCRLEINATGIAVFSGTKGTKKLCNLNWEDFVHKLKQV